MTKQLEELVREFRCMQADVEALQTWWCHQVKRAREEERLAVVWYLRAAAAGAASRGMRERADMFDEAATLVESQDYRREEDR